MRPSHHCVAPPRPEDEIISKRRAITLTALGVCGLLLGLLLLDLDSNSSGHNSVGPMLQPASPPPAAAGPALEGRGQVVPVALASLLVQVLDAVTGVPVPAAHLLGVPADAGHTVAATRAKILTADERGEITVPSAMWEEDRILIFTAHDYAPTAVRAKDLLATADQGRTHILLGPGVVLTGRVVTPWGAPVSDAEVCALGRYGADLDGAEQVLLPGPGTAGQVARTRTSEDGSFRLQGLAALPVRLEARKSGFSQRTDPEEAAYSAEAADLEHRIVLRPRLLAGLRVIDSSSGDVVPEFEVQILLPGVSGPVALTSESSSKRPGGIPEIGLPYRPGEWWVAGAYTDEAGGPEDEGHFAVAVTAPGFVRADSVGLTLRSADDPRSREPVAVRMTHTGPDERGALSIRVRPRVQGLALPWARVRIESASDPSPPGFPWTFRVDLDTAGEATHPIPLPPGPYRVRLAEGTGWATWQPRPEEPWVQIDIRGANQAVTADLPCSAALLRVSVRTVAGDPIGSFNLAIHDVTPRPSASGGEIAPFLAYLSEDAARWWDEPGHPYRAHLRMAPGLIEVLVPPGRVHVVVRKTGFRETEPRLLDLRDGESVASEFVLERDQ